MDRKTFLQIGVCIKHMYVLFFFLFFFLFLLKFDYDVAWGINSAYKVHEVAGGEVSDVGIG